MVASSSREAILLSDYNYYRNHTARRQQCRTYMRDVGMKKAGPWLGKMLSWCDSKGIDARRWLYYRFSTRHWYFAPPLNQLKPSKRNERKALDGFYNLNAAPAYSHRISNEIRYDRDSTGVLWDVNRDICHMAEAIKRRYAQNEAKGKGPGIARCMAEMREKTFGYHPKSRVCQVCPAAAICEQRTRALAPSFDIVALRRGDVDLQSCYVSAARYGG